MGIDGYPRNQENLDTWNAANTESPCDLKFVINLDCTEETCISRIKSRAASSGRADDNLEFLKNRFKTHEEATLPIIKHFEKQSLLRTINSNLSVDEVFNQIQKLF